MNKEGQLDHPTLSVVSADKGPWGNLEYYDTYLEAPDALLELLSLPSEQTVWNFQDLSRSEILALFESSGFTHQQISQLSEPARWSVQGQQTRIFPAPETVESLAPDARAQLYRVLAQWPDNPFHREPMVFDRLDLFQVLDRSGLPEELIQQIGRLVYQDGSITLFSDFPLLLRHLTHPRFERRLLRILTRTRTLLIRLHISKGENLNRLANYWSAGDRHHQAVPLLRSIAATEGVERLDIAHLLPANPRSQLYTYPSLANVFVEGRAPDSLWTAVNFFTNQPLPIYLDSPGAIDQIKKRFTATRPPFAFGDLILISSPETHLPCHACVYVAEDIVYTKHKAGFFSPWIFARMSDVISYHLRGQDQAEITAYRLANREVSS